MARPFERRNTRSYELKITRWSDEYNKKIRDIQIGWNTKIPPDRTSGKRGSWDSNKENTDSIQRIILEEYATLLKNKSVIYKRNYEYPEYWSKTRFDIITKIFTRKRILQKSTKENKN